MQKRLSELKLPRGAKQTPPFLGITLIPPSEVGRSVSQQTITT